MPFPLASFLRSILILDLLGTRHRQVDGPITGGGGGGGSAYKWKFKVF